MPFGPALDQRGRGVALGGKSADAPSLPVSGAGGPLAAWQGDGIGGCSDAKLPLSLSMSPERMWRVKSVPLVWSKLSVCGCGVGPSNPTAVHAQLVFSRPPMSFVAVVTSVLLGQPEPPGMAGVFHGSGCQTAADYSGRSGIPSVAILRDARAALAPVPFRTPSPTPKKQMRFSTCISFWGLGAAVALRERRRATEIGPTLHIMRRVSFQHRQEVKPQCAIP